MVIYYRSTSSYSWEGAPATTTPARTGGTGKLAPDHAQDNKQKEGIGMSARICSLIMLFVSITIFAKPQHNQLMINPKGQSHSAEQPAAKVSRFDFRDVRLLENPFLHAMKKDQEYILTLEPDRLLSRVREYAGLTPKAPAYGGWEKETISSHSLGHYLSACAIQYRASDDKRFLERVNYVVDQLAECQKANGNGYVAGIPNGKKVFAEVASGDIRSKGFDLNGLWVPWYVLHKIMAGLRDAYLYCDNTKAKEVMIGLADFSGDVVKNLNEEQMQKMLNCEHGGMMEMLADVYAFTKNPKYLALAKKFYHKAVLDPLAREEDRLQGLHGNTNIPKVIGAARLFELTGEKKFGTISEFFWTTVVKNHTYVAGGHGEREYFGAPERLNDRLSESTMETCNTYNMLKLTAFLFAREPNPDYAEFYERALYNHILASQNPDNGMVCYFVPLGSGTTKHYSTPFEDFSCCLGTGMENHSRYGESIYFSNSNELYVNLFIPSELNWRSKGVQIKQLTTFPRENVSRFIFSAQKPVKFTLQMRRPRWAGKDYAIRINGKPIEITLTPKNFIAINRIWRKVDTVEVTLPQRIRLESMPDNPRRVALLYGPILLAGDLGPVEGKAVVPNFITNMMAVQQWVEPVQAKELTFTTVGVGRPNDVTLIPFYQMHNRRYAVYWDIFTDREWKDREQALLAEQSRLKELESRTVDFVRVGEMQPERDHNMQGEKTHVGRHMGKPWRHATDGGWFSFDLKVLPDQPQELSVTYWGGDSRNREFEIYADGQKIGKQVLENNKPGEYFDQAYPIPEAVTKGKEKLTIKFQALPGKYAGGVFGIRIVKTKQ
ncbi:MAG: beta-L-arabinofuranosidase domain-containing protein [bacterium]